MSNYHLLLIICWVAIVLLIAIICKKNWPEKKEVSRKIVHIGTGPIIPIAWWLNVSEEVAIPIAISVTIALILNHRFRVLVAIEDITRKSYGTIAYGISISILLALFWKETPAAVCAGVLVMAFGDGLAGLIGPQINSPSWKILGQRKSIAGTITMTLVTSILLVSLIILSGEVINPLKIIGVVSVTTLLEQIGPWGIDNLTVPIGVGLSWAWMT